MFSIDEQININRPPQDVFDFVADMRNEVAWNPLIKSAVLVSGEPITQGTRFDVVRKGSGVSHLEITEFRRPTRLSYKGTFRGGMYTYTGAFQPANGGTKLSEHLEMTLKGPMKLMTGMVRRRLHREVAETAERMKARLDSDLPEGARS